MNSGPGKFALDEHIQSISPPPGCEASLDVLKCLSNWIAKAQKGMFQSGQILEKSWQLIVFLQKLEKYWPTFWAILEKVKINVATFWAFFGKNGLL